MDSISRVTSLLEAARELTLEASRDASAARKPLRPLPPDQIKKLLGSRSEREVLDGLKRVVTMQYTSPLSATLPFFAAVLNTLSQPTPSTRPLVYAYLIHHAEAEPDTALLAINTIQKSLSDSNPRVRAMALRTMSGIKVPVISQIVSLAIKKGISDMSPIVRKAAAFACVKCVRLDPSSLPQVIDYLAQLLGDQQYYVAGAAVIAFMELCPERIDLVHRHYRTLVRKLVDMDEWSQLATLKLLTTYARKCFPYRSKQVRKAPKSQTERAKDFYNEPSGGDGDANVETIEQQQLDPDLKLFLDACLPLLQSRTSAVILEVTHSFSALAPSIFLHRAIAPLIALLRTQPDIRLVSLYNIVQVCLAEPQLFVPHYRHFTLHASDPLTHFRLKLEIISLIFPHCDASRQSLTMAELEHFSRSHDPSIVREAVRAVGRCAQSSTAAVAARCLRLLLRQIHSPDATLVAEALDVVRHLIQQNPQRHRKTVVRLARNLDTLRSDKARASVIWLVGEFAALSGKLEKSVAPDVLRILVKGYADEGHEVRMQIVLLAAKVYLLWSNEKNQHRSGGEGDTPTEKLGTASDRTADASLEHKHDAGGFTELSYEASSANESTTRPDRMELLWQHVLLLARYTPDYDLRDRARLFRALLATPSATTDLASLLLLAPKPVPLAPSPGTSRKGFELGSASLVVGADEVGVAGLKGYEALPAWVEEGREPNPRLRDAPGDEGIAAARGRDMLGGKDRTAGAVAAGKLLDDALEADAARDNGGAGKTAAVRKEKTLDSWLDEDEVADGPDVEESEGSEEETSSEGEYESGEDESSEECSGEDEDDDSDDSDDDDDDDDEHAGLVKGH